MIVWINGAIKWFQDNNVFTHAVGFALIGIGVAVFFVSPNLHHRSSKWATCDAIWIRPDARRPMVSMRLIRFSENMLFAEGAEIIRMGAKVRRPALAHLLTHMGYDAVEIHYQKVRP